MAYDRYVAICKPLHYGTLMDRRACTQMAASAWVSAIGYSALHSGNTFTLPFCDSNVINQFFCDIPQVVKLSCSDANISEIGIVAFGVCLGLVCFAFILVSYVQIFITVRRIPSEQGKHKAFSTCIPHIMVVTLFLSNGIVAYLKPTSNSPSAFDILVGVLYSTVPQVMNPVIYSIRNKEMKVALWEVIQWILFRRNYSCSFP
ncbi:olfactory receptor 14A16-like [Alligator sinensis]|uniref:Olfactory receptor 14A16-like n=1 Tax=Alligator sinensis TaxID=38654 RepID=A0A1U7SKA3_ALLSI|nr:olfactory receptor 14A16-like [Alligator sinensis]